MNRKNRNFALFAIFLILGFAAITVIPEDADARRFGGGRSFGSRGSKSFFKPKKVSPTPRTAQPRQTTPTKQKTNAAAAQPARGGMFGGGMMGMMGGLLMGGLIGSLLFGGMGGAGMGGIGLLEILLIGGGIWFLMRWMRRRNESAPQPAEGPPSPYHREPVEPQAPQAPPAGSGGADPDLPETFSMGGDAGDEVTQGLNQVASMDPNFDEAEFLEGAKGAFGMVQSAWADWNVEKLRPLLSDRMLEMAGQQAAELKELGHRNVIEKIDFETVEVSEAWQESGQDWLAVHFKVSLVDYETDLSGQVVEGNPEVPIQVEEYWTFTRPVGSPNPNWTLSAIQQPGEVAQSTW